MERIEIDGPFFSVLLCYSAISYCSLAEKWSKITAGGLQRQICFLSFFFSLFAGFAKTNLPSLFLLSLFFFHFFSASLVQKDMTRYQISERLQLIL